MIDGEGRIAIARARDDGGQSLPEKPLLQPARGFAFWTDGTQRILFAGILNYLYALSPETGQPITSFGNSGRIDIRQALTNGDVSKSFAAIHGNPASG